MTELVIMMGNMSMHPTAKEIITRWNGRQNMADDAGVDIFAVHRWWQRNRIAPGYDGKLIAGASARGFSVSFEELDAQRSRHAAQAGHVNQPAQGVGRKKASGVA